MVLWIRYTCATIANRWNWHEKCGRHVFRYFALLGVCGGASPGSHKPCPHLKAYMGVDQKVLARSYVFGDHSSWLKSLRERSAMEFAKETYFFSRKIPRWILGGMPVHLHICRPRSLVDREIRRTYTCIIDSLPVLGMVQINNVGWAILEQVSRKTGERPGSLLQGSAHRRQAQVARVNDGDCLHLTLRTARK